MVILRELKRRKVLRTLSLYVVGCWVVLQVIEVLSDAGLPPTTMRQVLFAMTACFPVVTIVSWYFDISAEGISRTSTRRSDEELPTLAPGDHALLVGLVAVLTLTAWVLSMPPAESEPRETRGGFTLAVLGFDDVVGGNDEDAVGEAIADELRSEFSRIAGVRVLGRETSRAIRQAGEGRDAIAAELGVTSILTGIAGLENDEIRLRARVTDIGSRTVVWQSEFTAPVGEGPDLQRRVVRAVLDGVISTASADSALAPRVPSGECEAVYDLYLRGKQLWLRNSRDRAMDLMREASRLDAECGVVWEAIAVMSIDWTKEGFAKAGAAARRALEINESLSRAWATLAEIAEEERRWSEAERLFQRALYANPVDGFVNALYAETLLARGRVRDALHYALEGYRYEPALDRANWMVSMAARYAGEADLAIKHAQIFAELRGNTERYGWEDIGAALIMKGQVEQAAELYESKTGEYVADWYPQCVRTLVETESRVDIVAGMEETLRAWRAGELTGWQAWYAPGHLILCSTRIGELNIALDVLTTDDVPTEAEFIMFFMSETAPLRQTEYFRRLVVESGLVDYWREWGWSDYCRPDEESFICD